MSNYKLILHLITTYKQIVEGWEGGEWNLNDYIEFVMDRKGHDMRYAIDHSKISDKLGWYPEKCFSTGIAETIKWYLDNEEWLDNVTSGEYKEYYNKQYGRETLQK